MSASPFGPVPECSLSAASAGALLPKSPERAVRGPFPALPPFNLIGQVPASTRFAATSALFGWKAIQSRGQALEQGAYRNPHAVSSVKS